MSEKIQRNAHLNQLKMLNNYGDEYHHKHNKYHLTFRKHFKSHPVQTHVLDLDHQDLSDLERSTGHVRQGNLKKVRTKIQRHHEHREG